MSGSVRAVQPVLNGLHVVDLSMGRAGGVAGMLLADLGARVSRVQTHAGEHQRPDPSVLPDWVAWDRRKTISVVDHLDPLVDRALDELLRHADAILVDAPPARLDPVALGPEALLNRYPRAIVVWMPPYGDHGDPYSDLEGDPLLLSAITSFAFHQPAYEDVPVAPVVPAIEHVNGALSAAALLAGLLERRSSGKGQVVTVSGLNAAGAMAASLICGSLEDGPVVRAGRNPAAGPPFRLYRCGDGKWLFLGALVPAIFMRALDAMDAVDVMLIDGVDGDFMNLMKPDLGLKVTALLMERFASQPLAHWLDLFAEADIPAAAVQTRAAWKEDEAFVAVGGCWSFEHPSLGSVSTPSTPVSVEAAPVGDKRDAPHWPHATQSPEGEGPLRGLKVIDMSNYLAGPFGGELLAQWGAEVIKVEPTTGDPYDIYSLAYMMTNAGKKLTQFDQKSPEGRRCVERLLQRSDVLLDNLRPNVSQALGLGANELRSLNPTLVHTNVTAFGSTSPFAHRPGFDPIIQALSGLILASSGDAEPTSTSTPVHDVAASALATVGTLAALWARAESGNGATVVTSLAAASGLIQCAELTDWQGRPPTNTGGRDFLGDGALHRYYRASDGWIALGSRDEHEDHRALLALDVSGVDDGPAGDLAASIAAVIGARSQEEIVQLLTDHAVPCTSVVDFDGWKDDPYLIENRFFSEVHDERIGRSLCLMGFARFSRSKERWFTTMAAPGADTKAVRRDLFSSKI
jgi:crotonobetainyl-CoA:carnitine CoA-transferase CaiB-like acyl-CoA transferase